MKLSVKSPNGLSLILAAVLLTTASIVLANRSQRPTSTTQHIAPTTTTGLPNGFVDDSFSRRTSPVPLPTASPTPSPSRIYRVIEVTSEQSAFAPSGKLGERGEVLGTNNSGNTPAAIWRNGVIQEIPTSNALSSVAYDINESNQVVGRAFFEPDVPEGFRRLLMVAYILPDTPLPDPYGVVQDPDNPFIAFQRAEAVANNNVGQVIGYSIANPHLAPYGFQALLWDTRVSGNPFEILSPLPGDSESLPSDINDNGTVVGESGNNLDTYITVSAVVWKKGRVIDVGKLPGFNRCQATSINSFDYVVGACEKTPGVLQREGFLWHDDNSNGESDTGELRTLRPFLPTSLYYANYDINDHGQLVAGQFIYSDENSNGLPDTGETKDLNSLVIDPSHVIQHTIAINNRGQILAVAQKRDAQGVNVWSGYVLLDPTGPVIFVPGAAGSVLVDRNEELWPALSANHRRLTLFPSDNPSQDIEATDAIRYFIPIIWPIYDRFFKYLTDVGEFTEYKVDGNPSKQTTTGCDLTQKRQDPNLNPNFFVFAYDWRKSNVENAAKLKDYVGCVRRFHPDTKINIIAHSAGGLLSRRYVLDNPNDHHITRLITIGTPWLGEPKVLRVLETGEFLGLEPIYLSVEDLKYIAPSQIGVHQSLPSRAYQDLGGPPIFVKQGWDYDNTGERYESYDYDQVVRFLDKKYCPEKPCQRMPGTDGPGTTGHSFHSYSTAFGEQDDWHSDSTGVNYFHFYGVQRLNKTIGQVVAKPIIKCLTIPSAPIPLTRCYSSNDLESVPTVGDGSVPELSASRKTSLLDLNAPNAKVVRVTNNNDDLAQHVGILHNPDIHSAILTLLRGGTVPSSISSASLGGSAEKSFANHAQANDSSSTLSYYVSISGGSSVVVTDSQGNSTAPIEVALMGSVPDVAILSIGPVAMISLPVATTKQYTITFNVGDEPLDVRIVKGETNIRPTGIIRYQDISIPAGVSAKLDMSATGFENLRYDSDGNGSYDASVGPTLVVSGSAALDITAPTLTFAESRQSPIVAQVTITAADSGTGVRDVNYSTDGSSFQAYTSSLSLDPIQTPIISAFVTDNAGNRSPIVTYPLGSPSIRIRGTVKNQAGNLLSGATITLRGTTSATTQTDISGNYEFANLPAGGYYGLSASLSGFDFSSDDRVVSNPITDRTVDFIGEGACEVASVTSQPTAQTVCESSSASFSVTATGTNVSFQWRKNGVPLNNGDNISGVDSATLTINSVGPGDADTYDVVITSSCAPSTASNEASLIVIPVTASEWLDTDGDGTGNNSDLDDDGDGLSDATDNCPLTVNRNQEDDDGDLIGNVCDSVANPYLSTSGGPPHIVFIGSRDGTRAIYGMRADGTAIVRLTNGRGFVGDPAMSPDKTKIAFTYRPDGGSSIEIYWMKSDGTCLTRLTNNLWRDSDPAWSPDGHKIIFSSSRYGKNRIYSVEVADCKDGSTSIPIETQLSDEEGTEPTWSPNGCKIVFNGRRGPGGGWNLIFSMNPDGTDLRFIATHVPFNSHPTWSPDGRRIAFLKFVNGFTRLYTMNADGSDVQPYLSHLAGAEEPSWGANGKIAFRFNGDIYRANPDGSGLTLMTLSRAFEGAPSW